MLGADHPDQPAQSGLLQVRHVAVDHSLGVAGHHEEPGVLAGGLRQLTGNAHKMLHVVVPQLR